MYQIISKADGQGRADMESFVSTHPKGHFLQSTYWPAAKPQWDWRGVLSRDESGAVRGACPFSSDACPAASPSCTPPAARCATSGTPL